MDGWLTAVLSQGSTGSQGRDWHRTLLLGVVRLHEGCVQGTATHTVSEDDIAQGEQVGREDDPGWHAETPFFKLRNVKMSRCLLPIVHPQLIFLQARKTFNPKSPFPSPPNPSPLRNHAHEAWVPKSDRWSEWVLEDKTAQGRAEPQTSPRNSNLTSTRGLQVGKGHSRSRGLASPC